MSAQRRSWGDGWRGVGLIAITYAYFLIFAQFGFLARLGELGIVADHLKITMAAMALGGVGFSFLAPRLVAIASPATLMRIGFGVCAGAAGLTLMRLNLFGSVATAFLIGAGLGVLTVTLVTYLRVWIGSRDALLKVGLGTGLGYLVCNIPAIFAAGARAQALVAGGVCLLGMFAVSTGEEEPEQELAERTGPAVPFCAVVLAFTALVWFDSAAFFIIQSTPALKAGTWGGDVHLWTNAFLHLAAALGSAWLLRRKGLSTVLLLAVAGLACACLLLLDPSRVLLASVVYPVGVSLYSVALVAYPSLLSAAGSSRERGRQAGWIYAVAGWCGSALGIGMGQNLGHVPVLFVLVVCATVLATQGGRFLRGRRRELIGTAVLLLGCLGLYRWSEKQTPSDELGAVERGRQVYISEGCINCHSQYVRPHTADVVMWGPVQTLEEIHRARPPLIGNRRQGPDLSEVGGRRSRLWLRAHFEDPAEVSHASFMPSYRRLFLTSQGRGDDLIEYLASLHGSDAAQHKAIETGWHLAPESVANAEQGARLFAQHCATCHTAAGATRKKWQGSFRRLPPILQAEPLREVSQQLPPSERYARFARIIKFGLPGTDMAGHEYFPDDDVASLSRWLVQNAAQPLSQPLQPSTSGGSQ